MSSTCRHQCIQAPWASPYSSGNAAPVVSSTPFDIYSSSARRTASAAWGASGRRASWGCDITNSELHVPATHRHVQRAPCDGRNKLSSMIQPCLVELIWRLPSASGALSPVGGRSRRLPSTASRIAWTDSVCTTRRLNTHQIGPITLRARAAPPHVTLAREPPSGGAPLGSR
jgi:hypothetical protein